MSKSDLRISIDTLYLGINLHLDDYEFFNEIKKDLFFSNFFIYDYKKGNRFYHACINQPFYGFYLYHDLRKGLPNSLMTLQLGGKFFRYWWVAIAFLNKLFKKFGSFITFQRCDVAVDILYKNEFDLMILDDDSFTNNLGFPTPSYSKDWSNRKIDFEYCGRLMPCGKHYINYVRQGKGDLLLRVYDKSLDLFEKYDGISYSQYYFLEDFYFKVFRIELQARGDKLKTFVESNKFDDYYSICEAFYFYIFKKYNFKNVELDDDFDSKKVGNFSNRRYLPTLEGKIRYCRQKFLKFYQEFVRYSDELKLILEDEEKLNRLLRSLNNKFFEENLKKNKEKFISDSNISINEPANVYVKNSLFDIDFEKINEEIKREKDLKSIPF